MRCQSNGVVKGALFIILLRRRRRRRTFGLRSSKTLMHASSSSRMAPSSSPTSAAVTARSSSLAVRWPLAAPFALTRCCDSLLSPDRPAEAEAPSSLFETPKRTGTSTGYSLGGGWLTSKVPSMRPGFGSCRAPGIGSLDGEFWVSPSQKRFLKSLEAVYAAELLPPKRTPRRYP